MNPFKSMTRALYIPGMLLLGACCCNKPVPQAPPPPTATPAPAPAPVKVAELSDIFFDFDRSTIKSESEAQLKENAEWMSDNSGKNLVLEGHCDERGTSEYNMALGERRAQSAKQFLMSIGVEPSRMTTISYGEEKPFDPGHNEAAWAKNRRVHFVEK